MSPNPARLLHDLSQLPMEQRLPSTEYRVLSTEYRSCKEAGQAKPMQRFSERPNFLSRQNGMLILADFDVDKSSETRIFGPATELTRGGDKQVRCC